MIFQTKTNTGTTRAKVAFLGKPAGQVIVKALRVKADKAGAIVTAYENVLAAGAATSTASAKSLAQLGNTAGAVACGASAGAWAVVEHLSGVGVGTIEAQVIKTLTAGKITFSAALSYTTVSGDKIYVTKTAVATVPVSVAVVSADGGEILAANKPGRALTLVLTGATAACAINYATATVD